MKKARYSEDQMVRILREADQMPVAQAARKHGVSEASIYASIGSINTLFSLFHQDKERY